MSPSAETKGETSHSQRQRYDLFDFAVRTMSPLQTFRPTHAFNWNQSQAIGKGVVAVTRLLGQEARACREKLYETLPQFSLRKHGPKTRPTIAAMNIGNTTPKYELNTVWTPTGFSASKPTVAIIKNMTAPAWMFCPPKAAAQYPNANNSANKNRFITP